ncbi:hypothetical protein BDY17DRAFT_117043 [Neohortaea acidophila]|uniref:Uncharacterized protein n=1 Tax=Neohortaea acidophila TaxID=245834 RepID=A0A6A6PVV8_9PEZI|nr:uncharacterized protein BDY17DRAFT_117043 [Neohortaea acidophila]KAF2483871.1 hypothetical protein BDY17DRAFT_117043 [Neohortaea acidophila]
MEMSGRRRMQCRHRILRPPLEPYFVLLRANGYHNLFNRTRATNGLCQHNLTHHLSFHAASTTCSKVLEQRTVLASVLPSVFAPLHPLARRPHSIRQDVIEKGIVPPGQPGVALARLPQIVEILAVRQCQRRLVRRRAIPKLRVRAVRGRAKGHLASRFR